MYTLIRGAMWQFGDYNERFASSEAELSLPCRDHTLLVLGTKGGPFLKVSTDQRPSFCAAARWPGDVIMVPAHLIYMQPVNKSWCFCKDIPTEMKRFITFFSPGALNWVALLSSEFYLPGNMQMLVGQLRNRKEFQRRGSRETAQVRFPLRPGMMRSLTVSIVGSLFYHLSESIVFLVDWQRLW